MDFCAQSASKWRRYDVLVDAWMVVELPICTRVSRFIFCHCGPISISLAKPSQHTDDSDVTDAGAISNVLLLGTR